MERKITIEESVPYTEDYQNKMHGRKSGGRTAGNALTGNG